ncbi:type I-F CRISPR-associated helicase Cas3f [Roseiconus lacunae]|uniref:Type I-F CRISPR-associated helicase Cas3f n=1 Tax=Roseiconus lacunae TaxID=2605694 RepID=A0ABT7PGF0_9BACT|nr:type I-F CRISPR-associated helicase Cas3f [Roseiconus lacunae]MDM4015564.1 type I-F CRISPR-associated helicase Cas3f [Roseiconus lacunae]
MIVTFISECRKKSIKKTQRILDTYAYRIGRRTWQANVTEQGLEAIRERLTNEATRSTAIACHRVTSRRQTELVWVVGNKRVFDSRGRVAVHRTRAKNVQSYTDGMWQHLPLVRSLARMSALWHDFGKASAPFQKSLLSGQPVDLFRHEWLSLALFDAFVANREDDVWLDDLSMIDEWWDNPSREQNWIQSGEAIAGRNPLRHDLEQPIARWIKWLIVSHHLLPRSPQTPICSDRAVGWNSVVAEIDVSWGFEKVADASKQAKAFGDAFTFKDGLPIRSQPWREAAADSAREMLSERSANLFSRWDQTDAFERSLLAFARSSLMAGDHSYSSEDNDKDWKSTYSPFANTRRKSLNDDPQESQNRLKQRLDEHLVRVSQSAEGVAKKLPFIGQKMPGLDLPRELRKPSPAKFAWQNKAVRKVQELCADRSQNPRDCPGTLVINTAGTGSGKTTANAKILGALRPNHLRVAFALGLRTLTLQTGDEYRERLKLRRRDLQIMIGSHAIEQLYDGRVDELDDHSIAGDFESTDVSDEEFFFGEANQYADEEQVLKKLLSKPKDRRLILAPFLVCTIDHLIPATDGVRGGRHLVPFFRLISSDVVIDEIDDYDVRDLIAILRLVHLVGMMGRNLLISSATITPSIALAVFEAYQCGRAEYAAFQAATSQVDVIWVNEFLPKSATAVDAKKFEQLHRLRATHQCKELSKATPKRLGKIVDIAAFGNSDAPTDSFASRHRQWVDLVAQTAIEAHRQHAQTDAKTGRLVSVGLIRMANIDPCVGVANHLLEMNLPDDVEIRIVVYHSRQVLIYRSEIESYLGPLLHRRQDQVLEDPIVRKRLDESDRKNVIFIVVASPVCEVGRDHDYDWAVVEPSSMRSLIQVSGRVLRHRNIRPVGSNIYVPTLNYKAFIKPESEAVFEKPGFEKVSVGSVKGRVLKSRYLTDIVEMERFSVGIDAQARLSPSETLAPASRLADLEHAVLSDVLNNQSRAEHSPHGWNHGYHYLTSTAQQAVRFRASAPDTSMYLHQDDDGNLVFYIPTTDGYFGSRATLKAYPIDDDSLHRLWLPAQDYGDLIASKSAQFELNPLSAMKRFGEVMISDRLLEKSQTPPIWIAELGVYHESQADPS